MLRGVCELVSKPEDFTIRHNKLISRPSSVVSSVPASQSKGPGFDSRWARSRKFGFSCLDLGTTYTRSGGTLNRGLVYVFYTETGWPFRIKSRVHPVMWRVLVSKIQGCQPGMTSRVASFEIILITQSTMLHCVVFWSTRKSDVYYTNITDRHEIKPGYRVD